MLKEIPKAQGKRTDLTSSRQDDEVGKRETTDELGFSRNQVSQFQRMAEGKNDTAVDLVKPKSTSAWMVCPRVRGTIEDFYQK